MYDFQKVALHALDRIQERTTLDPALIPLLQAEAERVSEFVPPGHYYLPLRQEGQPAGYAAFKTVDTAKGPKLVLATVLAPHMHPRGEDLSRLMLQPETAKAAADEAPEQAYSPENMRFLKQRFTRLQKQLHESGVYAGTGHQRIVIPKNILTEKDILQLGFKPVKVAIPESGQDRSESFRHPDNLFHIHSHPEGWTLHEDAHPAATMLATKVTSPLDKVKTYFQGIPHVVTEGVPGLFYYAKNQAAQATPLAKKVLDEMRMQGNDLYDRMQNWKVSPTFSPPPETQQELKAAAERILGGRADGKPDNAFDAKEIAKGMKVEREHTPDPAKQKEIAKDHLTESPRYYIELAKMEDKLKEKSAEVVATFRTSKDGRKKWRVDEADGKLTCTCPDYIYRHAGKGTHCKHIRQHLESKSPMQKVAFTKEAVGTRLLGRMLAAAGPATKETGITRGPMAQNLLAWLRPMREAREPMLEAMREGRRTPSYVLGVDDVMAQLSPRREWASWMKPDSGGVQQAFVTDPQTSLKEMASAIKQYPQYRKMIARDATLLREAPSVNQAALDVYTSGRHSPQDVIKLSPIQAATPESALREQGFNPQRYAYKGGVPTPLPANEPQWMTAIPSVAAGYAQSGHADKWGQSRIRAFDATRLREAGPWTSHIATDPRGIRGRLRLMLASLKPRPGIPNAGKSEVGASPYYERVVGSRQAEPIATYKPIAPEDGVYMRVRGAANPLATESKTADLKDILLGAGKGAVVPGLLGAGAGAFADDEDRVRGALKGGITGALIGAIPGGIHGHLDSKAVGLNADMHHARTYADAQHEAARNAGKGFWGNPFDDQAYSAYMRADDWARAASSMADQARQKWVDARANADTLGKWLLPTTAAGAALAGYGAGVPTDSEWERGSLLAGKTAAMRFGDHWQEMAPALRRALVGGVVGLGTGAVGGAVAGGDGSRVQTALAAGGAGALVGATGGLAYNKLRPMAANPTYVWAQALDNSGPDIHFRNGIANPHPPDAVSAVSRTSRLGKVIHETPSVKVTRTGRNYIVEFVSKERDTAGRLAPIVVHGSLPEKWDVETLIQQARPQAELTGRKLAALLTDLKPHQQRVVDRMSNEDQKGLVVVHGLGSGKTLTSIAVADRLGLPADVVTPAALQENYRKEVAKHLDKPFPMNLQSLEATARNGGQSLVNPLLIIDEVHRLRNPGKTQKAVMDAAAQKRLLLTGSLMYNHPADMAAPINLAAGETVLPSNQSDFESRYIHERRISPGFFGSLVGKPGETRLEIPEYRKPELKKILQKYVDYHPGSTEGFPTTEEQQVKVPMTERQRKIYDTIIEAAPPWVAQKIRSNMPPTKSEAKELNTFLTGIRQVSNSTAAYDMKHNPEHPKIDRAVQELQALLEKNPKAKAVVYSNFLPSGIIPYRRKLEELGIPYGEFTGEMPRSQREQLVRDYNDNKLKALLLSSAGGEGLDLKGTSLIQLLEPHWNEEKLKQVIGRGIRYKSHDDLPPEERKVLIQRFLATRPRSGILEKMHLRDPGASVDEFLYNMGMRKEQIKNEFKKLLVTPELQ